MLVKILLFLATHVVVAVASVGHVRHDDRGRELLLSEYLFRLFSASSFFGEWESSG